MNAEEFLREFAGFEPDTPIGVEWVPFSSLKDACKAMEEYAAAKENEWNDEAVKPPCLPHLVGTGREQSDKVIAHGYGITFFAIYHHSKNKWIPSPVTHWMRCPNDPKK